MTGHGEAHHHTDGVSIGVEVRTVNNRYLKVSIRTSEGYGSLESSIEQVVRETLRRGSVQLSLRIDRESSSDDYQLNAAVLQGYLRQIEQLQGSGGISGAVRIEQLLSLPGVVKTHSTSTELAERDWPAIQQALREALAKLEAMRRSEGAAMAVDLLSNCQVVASQLVFVEKRAPAVIDAYRTRLVDRLSKLLAEFNVSVTAADIVREVGMYAEKSDISEEVVRLRSHVEQFERVMKNEETPGRKLEFLTQEMFRETNTIGSKSNDAEIATHVIEIKTAIERMREMIQNVE
jgi:uncharacterized protein (TIGR00255 family)